MKIPIKDIVFVVLQFALFIAYVWEVKYMEISLPPVFFWVGLAMLVLGAIISLVGVLQLNVHLSPFPSPLPGSKLIENGVYKFIRHPIYSGILFALFGFGFLAHSGYKLAIAVILYFLFYLKTKYEEKRLLEVFPGYSDYQKRTGRFFPRIKT